ncbi:hypothetical protein ACQPYH_27885 [Kribbella sp. CA-245084]|uniref:hypothetical protein n=1 Tax=Kribbella sp. CA-245084 TaxID=3239940 RepID=UPI003D92A460
MARTDPRGCHGTREPLSSPGPAVGALVDDIGYAAVDLGSLSAGSALQQPGGPLAGRDLRLAYDALAE